MYSWPASKENLPYLIGLSWFVEFGSRKLLKLKEIFANPAAVWRASIAALNVAGLEQNTIDEFLLFRTGLDLESELNKFAREEVKLLTVDDPLYPPLLKEIYDPPVILYYRGRLIAGEKNSLAVVGSRLISPYGLQITPEIVCPLAAQGLTIVSGLAIGVDALAHLSALKASGRAIAVLGSGLDEQSIYPPQNRHLARQIIEQGGALLSEFPIGAPPKKQNFPIRNRIISGLSLGTLVVEAAAESGSLITARCALEQNREIFAVPGAIHSPQAEGSNNLLKMGARLVTSAADILEAFNIEQIKEFLAERKITAESPEEEVLLPHLSREPQHIDNLVKLSRLPSSQVMSALTMMEIKGKVRNLGSMMYVLNQ